MHRMVRHALAAMAIAAALVGCASQPQSTTSLDYKSRAVTRSDGGLGVSTAVLSAAESEAVYGVPLANKSIQPVWVEVKNREDRAYYLLSPGLDPNFFPASEAAEAFFPGARRTSGRRSTGTFVGWPSATLSHLARQLRASF